MNYPTLLFRVLLGVCGIGCDFTVAGAAEPNRQIPAHTAPSIETKFSSRPSTEEICQARIFAEPLVPVGSAPTLLENQQVAAALSAYRHRTESDDFTALEGYLTEHGSSPWAPALTFDLAMECYHSGWYTKALGGFERAWPLLKPATDLAGKALADRAAGELAYMYGRLGRMGELAALLDTVKERPLVGPATEKIAGAQEGLWTMLNRPETAFKCGPYALGCLLAQANPIRQEMQLIRAFPSSTNGCSLNQVASLSSQLGLNYQMAFRNPGAPVLIPAVVHWKAGHYAALLKTQNGQYLLQDPTFGNDAWISSRAFDAETSGYFLVAPGKLPSGWRAVPESEGSRIFGKGQTTSKDDSSTTPCDPKSCWSGEGPGMPVNSTHLMLVSLHLQDRPVGYLPPVGPSVYFDLTYNQRDAGQIGNFNYSNLGPKWTFNWLAYISDDTATPLAAVTYYTDEGGTLSFSGFNSTNQTFAPQMKSEALLQRTSTTSYRMLLKDGSQIVFDQPDGGTTSRRVFMTQKIDPAGNTVQITYDASFRVVAVSDAIGQVTTFSYGNTNDPLKITRVTDPFGRFASFSYDASNRLAKLTDVIGLSSQFTYDAGDFIQAMTTPYGTTSFQKGGTEPQRWLVTTYPNGEQDRVEFLESSAIGINDSDPVATLPAGVAVQDQYLVYRNSFYWDRHAYAEAPGDYTKARLYHWLHFSGGVCSGILESQREPLENRVWYNYASQSGGSIFIGASDQPIAIGRVLDDGTTQLRTFGYNAIGNVTNAVDPASRSISFLYDTNLVDLLEVRQTTGGNNDRLARFLYNSQHLPVVKWNATGLPTTNTYNTRGQLVTTTNPNGETTTLSYDTNGYLLSIDGPLPGNSDTVSFTYDTVGRIRTLTDPDGFTITNNYDNFDRPTNVSYPDGTFAAFTYDRLDRVSARDRLGRVTQFVYDALRRLTSVTDPLDRTVTLQYCGCGGLSALVDAMGRQTIWDHDIQGRLASKQYADGSTIIYNYENSTSRLKSIRDEKGQLTSFAYAVDDNLLTASYPIAQTPTPPVNFTYDTVYDRLLAIQDGIGTTTFSYNPVGSIGALQPAAISGPLTNVTVTYAYDALGRATNRAIDGVMQAMAYDPLGRITNFANALGSFGYVYDGASPRVLNALYPNGQTTHFDYFGNLGDRRLQQITDRRSDNSIISRFAYLYNPVAQVTNWIQELGSLTNQWTLAYDPADQLTGALVSQTTSNVNFSYSYDQAGNRLAETISATNRAFQYNSLNQLVWSSDVTATNVTYEWDAAERVTAVNTGPARSEFSYDAFGHRCRIVEKTNSVVWSDKRYVWCGSELCEERDSSGKVLQRFFPQGVVAGGANYYYTRDHLGSIRELVDTSGAVQSRYTYNPYGQRTALQENTPATFAYTGHFLHRASGLYLTPHRALNSATGRWLTRDPLGEDQGLNLYAYVGNNPINLADPLGLCEGGDDGKTGLQKLGDAIENAGDIGGHIVEALTELNQEGSAALLKNLRQKLVIGYGGVTKKGFDLFAEAAEQRTAVLESFGKVFGGFGIGVATGHFFHEPNGGNALNVGYAVAQLNPTVGASAFWIDVGKGLGRCAVGAGNQLALKYLWDNSQAKADAFWLGLGDTAFFRGLDWAEYQLNRPWNWP